MEKSTTTKKGNGTKMKTQFEKYIQSEINWKKAGMDDGPKIKNSDFKVVESFGDADKIAELTENAIALSIVMGMTGCTQSIQDADGNVKAFVTVKRG